MRRALRAITDRAMTTGDAAFREASSSDSTRSAAPVGGNCLPSTLAIIGRASAADDHAMVRPTRATVVPTV